MKKSELIRKIRKEFPDLKWKTARHNVEGWDHYVLMLDNKYIFRFPREKAYLRKLKTEVEFFRYLKDKVNIPIPQYKFVAYDKSFAGYEMLQGVELTPEVFHKLPPATQRKVAQELAQFISTMHRVPLKVAKKFSPDYESTAYVLNELRVKTKKFVFAKITKQHQQIIEEYIRELAAVKFDKIVFIHNDIYPSHILLSPDKKRLSGIIDFADRAIDDPAVDFGELWVYGRRFIETLYKYYTGPKDKTFIRRSQMYYKRMPIWMMISTAQERKGNFRENYQIFKKIFLDKKTFS